MDYEELIMNNAEGFRVRMNCYCYAHRTAIVQGSALLSALTGESMSRKDLLY